MQLYFYGDSLLRKITDGIAKSMAFIKAWRFLVLIFIYGTSQAQNLVLNGSFENYNGCPTNFSQIDSAFFWTTPTAFSSSDYYNSCATAASSVGVPLNGPGFQDAHTGLAYAGIYVYFPAATNYREYLEVELADTLIENGCYHFEMYVNLTNTCKLTTDAIAVYFSDSLISGLTDFDPLPVAPQISNVAGNLFDTLAWTLVSGLFQATGKETHLVIGNFSDDAGTESVLVNNDAPFDFCYVLVDDVSLVPCKTTAAEILEEQTIHIYPNPSTDQLIIDLNSNESAVVNLYDFRQQRILQQSFHHSIVLPILHLERGLYICEVAGKYSTTRKIIAIQ